MVNEALDKEKYKAALVYMLSKEGGIEGKKKMYKLFYFLDFDYYEAFGKSFTGETYTALKMGPAPQYFDAISRELEKAGVIEIKKIRKLADHENDTVVYNAKKKIDYKFSAREKKMLDRIMKQYGDNTGKQLEDISHCQAPYRASDIGDVIPYELSYYRDTPGLTE